MLLFAIGSESCRKDFSKEICLWSSASQCLYIPIKGGPMCSTFATAFSLQHADRPGMEEGHARLNAQMCICSLWWWWWWFFYNKIFDTARFFDFKLILLCNSVTFFLLSWILIWFSDTLFGFVCDFCICRDEFQLITIVLDGNHLIKHTVLISWR